MSDGIDTQTCGFRPARRLEMADDFKPSVVRCADGGRHEIWRQIAVDLDEVDFRRRLRRDFALDVRVRSYRPREPVETRRTISGSPRGQDERAGDLS